MRVYKILTNRYYGGELLVPDSTRGIPAGTTRTPPPPVAEHNQYLIWNGNGWLLTDNPPPTDLYDSVVTIEEISTTSNEEIDSDNSMQDSLLSNNEIIEQEASTDP